MVHLIRVAKRFVNYFVNYKDRKAVCATLKLIYEAVNADAASAELDAL